MANPSPSVPCMPSPPAPRGIVVVLGSGRSGTSLLMQVLAGLGMAVSEQLIQARPDNPEGFYEDSAIVRIQADLLRALGAWPFHPLPENWLEAPATASAAEALRAQLRARLHQHPGLWGFKDPRTAPFLPLWQRLFAEEGIEPRYILALREPGKIIQSFMQAYDTPADVAEQVWLRRTCNALRHTRAKCHIVHYEDWFMRPREVAEGLIRHTGLASGDIETSLGTIVRPDLDRARGSAHSLGNAAALTLYLALKACRGGEFDQEGLLGVVAGCCG